MVKRRPLTEAEAWREIAPRVFSGAHITGAIHAHRCRALSPSLRARMITRLLYHWTMPDSVLTKTTRAAKSLFCLFLACEAEGEG